MSKIGFIGLGIMGRPMAGHLKAAGHEVTVVERKSLTAEDRAGFAVVADAKAVAQAADIIILMVPDTPDVEAVLFGPGGVAEGLSRGKLVIDMSSISPTATKEYAKRVNALGCDYLDAPVSGGEVGAKQATLTIMVAARKRPSPAPSRCSRRWARTSPWSARTARARPPKLPTRSSWP